MTGTHEDTQRLTSPTTLVAVAWAAHRSGDRHTAAIAKRLLEERYGIKLAFRQKREKEPCDG